MTVHSYMYIHRQHTSLTVLGWRSCYPLLGAISALTFRKVTIWKWRKAATWPGVSSECTVWIGRRRKMVQKAMSCVLSEMTDICISAEIRAERALSGLSHANMYNLKKYWAWISPYRTWGHFWTTYMTKLWWIWYASILYVLAMYTETIFGEIWHIST